MSGLDEGAVKAVRLLRSYGGRLCVARLAVMRPGRIVELTDRGHDIDLEAAA